MVYNFKLIVIVFIIFFLGTKYLVKQYKNNCEADKTEIKTDVTEVPYGIDFRAINPDSVHHVFWTGGFDSTFRICQLLLLQDRFVQPIYIMCDNIDNNGFNRQSANLEIQKMKEMRDLIFKNNTHIVNRLFPTHYVLNIRKNQIISKKFKKIHKQLGYFSRDINQYEKLARFSLEYDKPIEVSVENCNTGLDEATKQFRIGTDKDCKIMHELPIKYNNLEIFKNFRFPIVHLTKNEMKNIAIRNNFYHILKNSWSCWFPQNGRPCGKCNMCKERII